MLFETEPLHSPGLEQLFSAPGPAALGPKPRRGRMPLAALEEALAAVFKRERIEPARHPFLRAALLLWHDHLDESHRLSQELLTREGSYLHGIMHRREPDYANASYWFNRVGAHPCFPFILDRVRNAPDFVEPARFARTCREDGLWDAPGFINACQEAAGLPRSRASVQALEGVQEVEMRCLTNYLLRA